MEFKRGAPLNLKYEANVRATVEGCELEGGKVRLRRRAEIPFLAPASQVVGVGREE